MALIPQLSRLAAAACVLVLGLVQTAGAARPGPMAPLQGALYQSITVSCEADREYRAEGTGGTDWADPNPWIHRRLDVYFDHPDLEAPLRVPGYFAGDGLGSRDGRVWRAHFTPNMTGQWRWFAVFEGGHLLNAAPPEVTGTLLTVTPDSGSFSVGPLDASAPGFQSKGAVIWSDRGAYFRYSERGAGRFVVAGLGSPENFLGYAGFTGAEDGSSADGQVCCCKQNCFNDCRQSTCSNAGDPAPNFLHRYAAHVDDWTVGDPDWDANGLTNQGRGIIGALNYLGEVGANTLYFMVMNLGGDGKDTHPFMTNGGGTDCPSPGSGFTPTHTLNYDVIRMDEWRTVFEHANDKGIMLQIMLAEQEACNIRWFGAHEPDGGPRNHLSVYRRLFMKQMVAEFGHVLALRWNLCEENKSVASCSSSNASCGVPATSNTTQFSAQELDEMARWIRSWDVMQHPIGVHTEPNDTRLYEELLALPEMPTWLTSTSLQIHGEFGTGSEYETVMADTQHLFSQAGHAIPIINDEQGRASDGLSAQSNLSAPATSTADDRRRRLLYDILLSGGQLSYYFGYYSVSNGGGDLRCEDFRSRSEALEQLGFARKVMETVKIWQMKDRDDLLVGATASSRFGRPEVAATEDMERVVVYFPALRDQPAGDVLTGSLDLRGFDRLTYQVIWLDPKNLQEVAQRTQIRGGEVTPMPVPDMNGDGIPGSSITEDTDLLVLLLSRGPSVMDSRGF